nr:metalloregulator ArsR/SmtB family transcription factor [Pontibacter qinzhouensis]
MSCTKRDVFQVIADSTRKAMLVMLITQAITPNALPEQFEVSRQAVSKHIRLLKECGVVEQQKADREICYRSKSDTMKETDKWLEQFRQHWDVRFNQLDQVLINLKSKKDEN